MKLTFTLFLLAALIHFTDLRAQSIQMPSDSSLILFPNNIKIPLTKATVRGRTYFQLERKAFKTLVLSTDYYLNQHALSGNSVTLLQRNQVSLDSTVKVMQQKISAEQERTKLYQASYEDIKAVSAKYDQELAACTADLAKLKKESDRAKKTGFIKGLVWGVAVMGAIVGIASIK